MQPRIQNFRMDFVSKKKANVLIICMAFAMAVVVVDSKVTTQKSAGRVNLNKHEKLVIFSFDGFRYDYMDKISTPTLDKLKYSGASSEYINSQFMTKTFVNHQSFVTGLYAESHGIVDNVVYDELHGGILSGFQEYNDPFWNYRDDVMPIWIQNECAGDGRVSGVQFPGANQEYGPSKSLPTHYLVYNGTRPYEERMDIVYEWLTHETQPANLIFMYFEEPDTTGHNYGPNSPEVLEQVQRMDNITKYLLDKLESAGILDEINFIFWSDHGMEQVDLSKRINVTQLLGKFNHSLYEEYGGTPVLHIRPVVGHELQVYNAFKAASVNQNFTVYNRSEIPARLHYQNNRRIMDIIVVADPEYVFHDYKFWLNDPAPKYGVHGYDNAAMSMKPFFIANGNLFKENFTTEPFDNIDLFPLIASIINIKPKPNNGTFAHVAGILKNASSVGDPSDSWICKTNDANITFGGFLWIYFVFLVLASATAAVDRIFL